jgi:hypothetical protein
MVIAIGSGCEMMSMFKQLLKILLWLIGSGILLLVLMLAGIYLYYAIPMQERFAKLEIGDAVVGCPQLAYAYPPRFITLFERMEKGAIRHVLARQALEDWTAKETRSLWRNLQELIAGLEIERHYTKQQQVWIAMNNGYMASRPDNCPIRGMNDASHYYFGKPPVQLSVAEMALLVGIAKGAIYYNPFKYPDRALKRRNQILEISYNDKFITADEYQVALKVPLPTEPHL